jgi:hypothetical protein
MGFDEKVDRRGVVGSCEDLLRFQAMFSRHFMFAPVKAFGAAGEAAILKGLHRYGLYRAALIKQNLKRSKARLSAKSLVESWDMADLHLLTELGTGDIAGNEAEVTVTFRRSPDWERWKEYRRGADMARLYYRGVLPGIAEGLGAEVAFDAARLDLKKPWTVTWSMPKAKAGPSGPIRSRIFDRLPEAVNMARRTSMNNGALYYFCADEETKAFDMLGEAELRQQVRDLAHERADRQKALHTARGWELNVKTLMEHWDGQLISIWQFEPGLLTKGTWHQDCTWCPYAAAWEGLGKRARDLGYIYDYELHPTYYKRYNPEMIVQFEGIKTRGDRMCKFRISLPSAQKSNEPSFAGYTGKDV